MDREFPDNPLLVWSLSTFHATILTLALVFFGYRSDSLQVFLSGLNTALGFSLFITLWATTWWCTARALRGLKKNPSKDIRENFGQGVIGRFFIWAGVNGALFMSVIMVAGAVYGGLGKMSFSQFLDPLRGLSFLAPLAFIIGGIVGVLFAIIDFPLWLLSRKLLSMVTSGKSSEGY